MSLKKMKNLQEIIFPDNKLTEIFFNNESSDKKVSVDKVSSKNLTSINLKNNLLTSISFGKGEMSKLLKLDLTNNKIETLETYNLINIKEIYVSGNKIKEFKCKKLYRL